MAVFYNTQYGMYLEISRTFDQGFVFSSGFQKDERKIKSDFSINLEQMSIEGTNLLSRIKAGQGKKDVNGSQSIFTVVKEGSMFGLKAKSKSNPGDRIFLTVEAFVYKTSKWALVVRMTDFEVINLSEAQKILKFQKEKHSLVESDKIKVIFLSISAINKQTVIMMVTSVPCRNQDIPDLLDRLGLAKDSKKRAIDQLATHCVSLKQLTSCISIEVREASGSRHPPVPSLSSDHS